MNLHGRHYVAALGIFPFVFHQTSTQDRQNKTDKDPQRSNVSINDVNNESRTINKVLKEFALYILRQAGNVRNEEQCQKFPESEHVYRGIPSNGNGPLYTQHPSNLFKIFTAFCTDDSVSERDAQEAVDLIWKSIKGKVGGDDAPMPQPVVEFFGSTFRVSFSIPRELDTRQAVVEMKKFLRKQQEGTDGLQAFSEEQTSGPRGTATVVRSRSRHGGEVSLHILEEKSSDVGYSRIEYEASLNEENLQLLTVSMKGLHRQKYKDLESWLGDEGGPLREWNSHIDVGKYWNSLYDFIRDLENGNDIKEGSHGSWLEDLHTFLEKGFDYEESRRMKTNESILIRRLKLLGCSIVMPDEEMKDNANQADYAGAWPGFAGYEDQKKVITEDIILPIKHPEIYKNLKSRTRGKLSGRATGKVALFSGPPGTGKSSAAQAVASLVQLPLVHVHVHDDSNSSLLHLGKEHKLIRSIHACNDIKSGAIVLISLPEKSVSLLPLLLQAVDPVSEKTQFIVSTDSIDSIDVSCLNSFSTRIAFMIPSEKDSADIFRHYARHLSIKDTEYLASLSKGLSGADIKMICDRAEHQWAANICKGGSKDLAGAPGLEVYESVLSQAKPTHSSLT